MFHLKMIYKTRSKTLLLGTLLLFLYTLLANLVFQDTISWFYIKIFIIIFPVFYTGNVISNEYEYNRFGIIFTTQTPIYKQGASHFIVALLANCLMVILMYLSAYVVGLEQYWYGFIPLIAYITFLSTLAFTFSNLTRKNAVGFTVAILYWGLFFMVGTKANESLIPVSIMINLLFKYDIVWYNVLSMLSFSLILFLWNIWYLGKGEGIRKILGLIGTPLSLSLVLLLFIVPDTSYLTRTDWHSMSNSKVQILYQDIPSQLESELLTIWESTYEVLVDITGSDTIGNTLQISCETGVLENPTIADDAVTLSVLRTAFNDPIQGGEDFHISIPAAAFATHFLGKLDDYNIYKGFSTYLSYTRVLPHLYAKDNEAINAKYFYYQSADIIKNDYLESLESYLTTTTFNHWMAEEISGLILYLIDLTSPTALNEFLVELSHYEAPVTLDDIRKLTSKYIDANLVNEIIEIYNQTTLIY